LFWLPGLSEAKSGSELPYVQYGPGFRFAKSVKAVFRNLGEKKAEILEELHKAVDREDIKPRVEDIRRAMNPSRRRAKS